MSCCQKIGNIICDVNCLPKTKLPILNLSFYDIGLQLNNLEQKLIEIPSIYNLFTNPLENNNQNIYNQIQNICSDWVNQNIPNGFYKKITISDSLGMTYVFVKTGLNTSIVQLLNFYNPSSNFSNNNLPLYNFNFNASTDILFNPNNVNIITAQNIDGGVSTSPLTYLCEGNPDNPNSYQILSSLNLNSEIQQANMCKFGYATRTNFNNDVQYVVAKRLDGNYGFYLFISLYYENFSNSNI
jgi:hypothetical protein